MIDIFAEIKQKNRAIWLVAGLLIIYNFLRFFDVVGLPYILTHSAEIAGGLSFPAYQAAFRQYISVEAESLHMTAGFLRLILIYSGFLSLAYILFSVYLGMRKRPARYAVVGLVLVELLLDIVAGVKYGILPSKISVLIALFLLLFLFSPSMAKEFKR